jgi:hypothetical protein
MDGDVVTALKYLDPTDGQWKILPIIAVNEVIEGEQGPPGPQGPAGKTAYQIYREQGGDLATEGEWLASLQGPPGPEGPPGAAADPASFQTALMASLPSIVAPGANLLGMSGGRLAVPILPGTHAVDGPNPYTVTATTNPTGNIPGVAVEIVNPSATLGLKVLVQASIWANFGTTTNAPFYVLPTVLSGTATYVMNIAGHARGPGYECIHSMANYTIPAGQRATFGMTCYVGSGSRACALPRFCVTPIGYQ